MAFPECHTHLPKSEHTHTIIFLHGRGSNGFEFSEEIFSSTSSDGKNLPANFPSCRWVFPTSRDRWSTTFEEEQCAWFDAYSLDDTTKRSELQIEGLRESIFYIMDLLEREASLLNGRYDHIYLGGVSQGMAIALWTIFGAVATGRIQVRLGGVLGLCGWLPFAQELGNSIVERRARGLNEGAKVLFDLFNQKMAAPGLMQSSWPAEGELLTTPVFLAHGTDDAWVSVQLGLEAYQIMSNLVDRVEWHEFAGAERDGHWIKEPEGFDQIVRFLQGSSASKGEETFVGIHT